MWTEEEGRKRFNHSITDSKITAKAALECGSFVPDDEDEAESDEVSCVNCAYRRWGKDKIYCMKVK